MTDVTELDDFRGPCGDRCDCDGNCAWVDDDDFDTDDNCEGEDDWQTVTIDATLQKLLVVETDRIRLNASTTMVMDILGRLKLVRPVYERGVTRFESSAPLREMVLALPLYRFRAPD